MTGIILKCHVKYPTFPLVLSTKYRQNQVQSSSSRDLFTIYWFVLGTLSNLPKKKRNRKSFKVIKVDERKVTNQQKTTTPQSWHNQVFETAMKMSLSSRNHTNFVSTGSLDNSNHTLPIMVTSWLSHYLKAFLQGT